LYYFIIDNIYYAVFSKRNLYKVLEKKKLIPDVYHFEVFF